MRLRIEHLDDPVRVERFLCHSRHITDGVLDARSVAAKAHVEIAHQPGNPRRHDDRAQRESPIEVEHYGDVAGNGERVAHDRHQ